MGISSVCEIGIFSGKYKEDDKTCELNISERLTENRNTNSEFSILLIFSKSALFEYSVVISEQQSSALVK